MVVYLWKFLWKKTQSSLKYIKIALCVIVAYLLILSVFASVFQTNKKTIYTPPFSVSTSKKIDPIRAFITDKRINSTKTGRSVVSAYKGIVCSLIGEACYSDLNKKNPSSTAMVAASILAYPFLNPPASGVVVVKETLAQAGLIPKSYAAEGVGFASIRPLMGVWKTLRDVAYLILVLVIVTIGFMIMFRTKINPQTIVSVENSLPKIVMALIYITFSFAIAGFLIDLMYVVIVLIIAILGPEQTAGTTTTVKDLMAMFLQAKPGRIIDMLVNFNVFDTIFIKLPNGLLNVLGDFMGNTLRLLIFIATTVFINPYMGQLIQWFKELDISASASGGIVVATATVTAEGFIKSALSAAHSVWGWVLSMIVGVIATMFILGVIIFLTVLMLFFRILFLLFSNYIKLLILIVISPLFLLMEAVPGQSTFSTWIKNVLELLVPFPVIIATFLIGSIIMKTSTSGILWTPPFLYDITAEYLSAIIGMWVIFMIPEFVGIAQKAINPKPLPIDGGLGTFFGGAKNGVEAGLGEASKYALLADRVAPLARIYKMLGMAPGKMGK